MHGNATFSDIQEPILRNWLPRNRNSNKSNTTIEFWNLRWSKNKDSPSHCHDCLETEIATNQIQLLNSETSVGLKIKTLRVIVMTQQRSAKSAARRRATLRRYRPPLLDLAIALILHASPFGRSPSRGIGFVRSSCFQWPQAPASSLYSSPSVLVLQQRHTGSAFKLRQQRTILTPRRVRSSWSSTCRLCSRVETTATRMRWRKLCAKT